MKAKRQTPVYGNIQYLSCCDEQTQPCLKKKGGVVVVEDINWMTSNYPTPVETLPLPPWPGQRQHNSPNRDGLSDLFMMRRGPSSAQ